MVAWGYNRDNERLPQVNVGMFCTVEHKLPGFFSYYNSSIYDFTNLPYVLEQARSGKMVLSKMFPRLRLEDGGLPSLNHLI